MLEFWVSSLRSNQNNYSLSERTRWSNAALWLAIPCVKVGLSFLWLRTLSRKKSIRFKINRSFSDNYCSSKILSYYIGARTVLGEYLDRPLNLERRWLIPRVKMLRKIPRLRPVKVRHLKPNLDICEEKYYYRVVLLFSSVVTDPRIAGACHRMQGMNGRMNKMP